MSAYADPVGAAVVALYDGPTDAQLAAIEAEQAAETAVEELFGWQDRALCAQTDPEAFFPEKGGSTREAKKVCRGCEVRAECLEFALAHDERFGIWGGMSERERRQLKRKDPGERDTILAAEKKERAA